MDSKRQRNLQLGGPSSGPSLTHDTKREMEIFAGLNTDMSIDVLSQLYTKDLAGLKSVSKGWQNLISDRSFILAQSKKKEPLSGFFFQQRFQWIDEDMKTISYIPTGREGVQLQQHVFDFLPENVVVLTSCNGLVCCRSCIDWRNCIPGSQLKQYIYVCNPLNKEWSRLDWTEPDIGDIIALAFDPFQDFSETSTDFKLVRVLKSENVHGEYFSFNVYSSKTRTWKLSKEICYCRRNLYRNNCVFIGGVLHWLTIGGDILTFHVDNEFGLLISAPVPATVFKFVPEARIGEFEGRLHYIMISEEGLHLWSLEDYFDVKWSLKHSKTLGQMEEEHAQYLFKAYESFTFMQQFHKDDPWIDPLAFKDGVLLLRVSWTIYLYHIETSRMETVCEYSRLGGDSVFRPIVLPYSMSLVPL